jgi:hypothetical protein
MGDVELGSGVSQTQFGRGSIQPQLPTCVSTHRRVTVTPITQGSTLKGTGGQNPDTDSVGLMEEPTPWLLVFAYLGDRFRRENESGIALERIGEPMGVSKQHIMKLTKEQTVGLDVFWRIAEYLFDGSVDDMVRAARVWWSGLRPIEQGHLLAWSTSTSDERTKSKRGGKRKNAAQDAETARLEELRPAHVPQRHSTRVPTGKPAVGPKSPSPKNKGKK